MALGPVFNTELREIICQLHEYLQNEAVNAKKNKYPNFQNVLYRTAKATGLHARKISKILKNNKMAGEAGTSQTSQVKGKLIKEFDINQNNEEYQTIRDIIMNLHMHMHVKELATPDRLLMRLEKSIQFTRGKRGLIQILKMLKFKPYKNIIIEKNSERLKRIKFLKKMEKIRARGMQDLIYGYVGLLVLIALEEGKNTRIKDKHFLVAFAAGKSGFIKNSLFLHKLQEKTDKVVSSFCEKWFRDKLIPNVPINSVLIIDEGVKKKIFYNSPKWHSSREEMLKWLADNHIETDETLLRPELYEIIKNHKAHYGEHEYGLCMMNVQEYHPRLNPLEIIWAKLKDHVKKELPLNPNVNDLLLAVSGFLSDLNDESWQDAFFETLVYEQQLITDERMFDIRLEKMKSRCLILSEADVSDDSTDTEGTMSD